MLKKTQIIVFLFISFIAPSCTGDTASTNELTEDSLTVSETGTDLPMENVSEDPVTQKPNNTEDTPMLRGKLLRAFDTGQGPFYNVVIDVDGEEITFWAEGSEEIFQWENDFESYKDVSLSVWYSETKKLSAHSVSVLNDSSAYSSGTLGTGILIEAFAPGDTPGGLILENSKGEQVFFEGNFQIETDSSTLELVGEKVKLGFNQEIERWMTDFKYYNEISEEESFFLGSWKLTEGTKHPVSGELAISTLEISAGDGGYIIEYISGLGGTDTIYCSFSEESKSLIGSYRGQDNVLIKREASNKISFTIDPFGEFASVINDIYTKINN